MVYNLFAPTQDANINASLVLDQLEGTLSRQCSTINENEELQEEVKQFDSIPEDSDSTNSYKNADNISIQSLDILSEKRPKKFPTSKTSASLKDLHHIDSDSESGSKPDLIHIRELRKAFWSRKNKFAIRSKRFGFLRKKHHEHPGQADPKLGAIVSLAALAAGMTSFPIVHQHQESPDTQDTTKEQTEIQEVKEEEEKFEQEKAKTPEEEELEISMLCSKLEHEMHELEKLEQEVEQAELKNQPFWQPELLTQINRSQELTESMQTQLSQDNHQQSSSSAEVIKESVSAEVLDQPKVDYLKKPGFKIPPRLQKQKSMPSIDSLVMFTEGSETWL